MKMKYCYNSGKITGLPYIEAQRNFLNANHQIRFEGYVPVNPMTEGFPFVKKEVDRFEKARECITFLHFGGYIPDAQMHKSYQLLLNKIAKHIQQEIELKESNK